MTRYVCFMIPARNLSRGLMAKEGEKIIKLIFLFFFFIVFKILSILFK